MSDYDWIFEKWPNWLRWLCMIPLGIVAGIIASILCKFSLGYIGIYADAPISLLSSQYSSLAAMFYIVYVCAPRGKEIVSGTISLLMALLGAISTFLIAMNGNWFTWDFLITLLLFIGCLIYGIKMFMVYAENKIINITVNKSELNTDIYLED